MRVKVSIVHRSQRLSGDVETSMQQRTGTAKGKMGNMHSWGSRVWGHTSARYCHATGSTPGTGRALEVMASQWASPQNRA